MQVVQALITLPIALADNKSPAANQQAWSRIMPGCIGADGFDQAIFTVGPGLTGKTIHSKPGRRFNLEKCAGAIDKGAVHRSAGVRGMAKESRRCGDGGSFRGAHLSRVRARLRGIRLAGVT